MEPTIVATQGSMITNIKHCANQPTLSTMEYNVEKLAATDYTCMIVMEFQKGQNFMYCSLLCCGDELYKLVHNIAHHSFSKCYCSSIVGVNLYLDDTNFFKVCSNSIMSVNNRHNMYSFFPLHATHSHTVIEAQQVIVINRRRGLHWFYKRKARGRVLYFHNVGIEIKIGIL